MSGTETVVRYLPTVRALNLRKRFRFLGERLLDFSLQKSYVRSENVLVRERPITSIREVATRSGVSVSTVSRVFNGYDDVSAATRERVLEAARDLDYAPAAAARTLVKRRSEVVGVVLSTGEQHPDIHHPFFQGVLVGLKHGIGALGYDLLLFATETSGSPGSARTATRAGRGSTRWTGSC